MAKSNFIILDGIVILKKNIITYQLAEDFPDPGDKLLYIELRDSIKIYKHSETFNMLDSDISALGHKYFTTKQLKFSSEYNPKINLIVNRFLAFYHKPNG